MIAAGLLDDIIDRALAEDLAAGDLTTESTIPEDATAQAEVLARTRTVVAGTQAFSRTFYRVDPMVRVEARFEDGETAEAGELISIVEGPARSILMAERVALNFLQHLSGVATLTRQYVEALPEGCRTRITDTRKTTPGLRLLERAAVRSGGAKNHRSDLGAAVLIKDNHIDAVGGIAQAVSNARLRAPHTSRIEIEVTHLGALSEALEAGADIVMLDNFRPEDVPRALALAKGRAVVEVSGGVGLARVPELARLGVDVISVGALTHSAPAADISLRIVRSSARVTQA